MKNKREKRDHKSSRYKKFPWLKTFCYNGSKNFSNDCEENDKELLENINKELDTFSCNRKKRQKALFEVIRELFLHFWWKMQWNETKKWKIYWKKEMPISKRKDFTSILITKLLEFMIYMGIKLSKGSTDSSWVERVIQIIKILPDCDEAVCTSLLSQTITDKYYPVYIAILRSVLTFNNPQYVKEPVTFVKLIILFKKLKMHSKAERLVVKSLVKKVHPPPDLIPWISSFDFDVANLKDDEIVQQLLRKSSEGLLENIKLIIQEQELGDKGVIKSVSKKTDWVHPFQNSPKEVNLENLQDKTSKEQKKKEKNTIQNSLESIPSFSVLEEVDSAILSTSINECKEKDCDSNLNTNFSEKTPVRFDKADKYITKRKINPAPVNAKKRKLFNIDKFDYKVPESDDDMEKSKFASLTLNDSILRKTRNKIYYTLEETPLETVSIVYSTINESYQNIPVTQNGQQVTNNGLFKGDVQSPLLDSRPDLNDLVSLEACGSFLQNTDCNFIEQLPKDNMGEEAFSAVGEESIQFLVDSIVEKVSRYIDDDIFSGETDIYSNIFVDEIPKEKLNSTNNFHIFEKLITDIDSIPSTLTQNFSHKNSNIENQSLEYEFPIESSSFMESLIVSGKENLDDIAMNENPPKLSSTTSTPGISPHYFMDTLESTIKVECNLSGNRFDSSTMDINTSNNSIPLKIGIDLTNNKNIPQYQFSNSFSSLFSSNNSIQSLSKSSCCNSLQCQNSSDLSYESDTYAAQHHTYDSQRKIPVCVQPVIKTPNCSQSTPQHLLELRDSVLKNHLGESDFNHNSYLSADHIIFPRLDSCNHSLTNESTFSADNSLGPPDNNEVSPFKNHVCVQPVIKDSTIFSCSTPVHSLESNNSSSCHNSNERYFYPTTSSSSKFEQFSLSTYSSNNTQICTASNTFGTSNNNDSQYQSSTDLQEHHNPPSDYISIEPATLCIASLSVNSSLQRSTDDSLNSKSTFYDLNKTTEIMPLQSPIKEVFDDSLSSHLNPTNTSINKCDEEEQELVSNMYDKSKEKNLNSSTINGYNFRKRSEASGKKFLDSPISSPENTKMAYVQWKRWTKDEDESLIKSVESQIDKRWTEIASTLPNRSVEECQNRWEKINPRFVRGLWTKEEDERLVELVKKFGLAKWRQIASQFYGRNQKQCADRWNKHLKPEIKKTVITSVEENIIRQCLDKWGYRWNKIAEYVPGRTSVDIRNHWENIIRIHARIERKYGSIEKGSQATCEKDSEDC